MISDKPIVRVFKGVGYVTASLTLIFGLTQVWNAVSAYRVRKAEVRERIATSAIQRSGSDYRGAWETLEKAAAVESSPEVASHQEDVAMEWLRHIRVREGETFASIVKLLSPLLTRGVTQNEGKRKGDLLAHLGWGDFLRLREGDRQLRPDRYYDDALKADPANVFAHTFKAHWLLWNHGPLAEAAPHFQAAVDSGREREFVREYQFAALFNAGRPEDHAELLRVTASMVRNSEMVSPDIQRRLFTYVYWSARNDPEKREVFLKAVEPREHLKMFQTFYGPGTDTISSGYDVLRDFWLASMHERAGETAEALKIYRQMKTRFDERFKAGSVVRDEYIRAGEAAIRRLEGK
jgi:hypothetical protein